LSGYKVSAFSRQNLDTKNFLEVSQAFKALLLLRVRRRKDRNAKVYFYNNRSRRSCVILTRKTKKKRGITGEADGFEPPYETQIELELLGRI